MVAIDSPPLVRLRDAMLALLAGADSLDRAQLRSQLTNLGLAKVVAMAERAITHRSDRFALAEADATEVESGWRHALALHRTQVGLKRALDAAERDWREDPSEAAWSRLAEIQQQLAQGLEGEGAGDA